MQNYKNQRICMNKLLAQISIKSSFKVMEIGITKTFISTGFLYKTGKLASYEERE